MKHNIIICKNKLMVSYASEVTLKTMVKDKLKAILK